MQNKDSYRDSLGNIPPKKQQWSGLTDSKDQDIKRQIFRGEVAYDISLIPEGYTLDQVLDLYTKTGVLIYQSVDPNKVPISLTTKK